MAARAGCGADRGSRARCRRRPAPGSGATCAELTVPKPVATAGIGPAGASDVSGSHSRLVMKSGSYPARRPGRTRSTSRQGRVAGRRGPPARVAEGSQLSPAQAAAGGGAGHQRVAVSAARPRVRRHRWPTTGSSARTHQDGIGESRPTGQLVGGGAAEPEDRADVGDGDRAACGPPAAGPGGTAVTLSRFTGVLPSGPARRARGADSRAARDASAGSLMTRGGASSCQLILTMI